jgi:hypothetical protein
MKTIAAAFINAKRAFSPALKSETNPHFKSRYADLSTCLDAVNDALLANGIAVYQETFEDQTGVTVETVFLHESGESMRCGKLHVPAGKQDPQGYGSALTYCRRYSLMAACGIAPEDDDGNAASKPKAEAKAAPPKAALPESSVKAWLSSMEASETIDDLREARRVALGLAKDADDKSAYEKFVAKSAEVKAAKFEGVPA